MSVESGIIVPHAPVLLLGGKPELDIFGRSVTTATEKLEGCDLVVLLSPHGEADGVYAETSGTLEDFGVDDVQVKASTDPSFARELADAWGRPMSDADADHGVVGGLALSRLDVPVVACAISEVTGPNASSSVAQAVESGLLLADALQRTAADRRVGLVVSAHTAASLTPKAPMALRPEGKELDDLILDCLATDCGSIARVDPALWGEAGACGAGPLTTFGVLFEGRRADVLAYDHPFGVGYLVAMASA